MSMVIDLNVQSLGALAHDRGAPEGSAGGAARGGAVNEHGPIFVDAVADHVYTFGQTRPEPPFEISNDEKTQDRAWRYPLFGGDLGMDRETISPRWLRREAPLGPQEPGGVRDPVYSGVNAVRDRDPLNPLRAPLPEQAHGVLLAAPHTAQAAPAPPASIADAPQPGASPVRSVEQTSGTVMDMFA